MNHKMSAYLYLFILTDQAKGKIRHKAKLINRESTIRNGIHRVFISRNENCPGNLINSGLEPEIYGDLVHKSNETSGSAQWGHF